MKPYVGIVVMLAVCLSQASLGATGSELRLIEVAPDGRGFVEKGSGRPYVVFGTNYYDPNTGWAPKIWRQFDADRVRTHFSVMEDLGVNCARVFLTAGSFQPRADTVEEGALKKLDKLVEIARQAGIRLILTGPDHWEGYADYWRRDRFAGENALKALDRFWDVVGRRYQGEPAIFAWDLLNEPHIQWFVAGWRPMWHSWLQQNYGTWDNLKRAWADELKEAGTWTDVGIPEDKPASGNPRLRDWQLFRESLANRWVRRQVEAIRRADSTHLVTVGYIQWSYPLVRYGNPSRYAAFNPYVQARMLDFLTIHFYPTMGPPFASQDNWNANIAYLQAVVAFCHAGKPVVLGEYGWYGGGAPQKHPYLNEQQQAQWLAAEVDATRPLVCGWLSWPFADSPSSTDISLFGGLVKPDLTLKDWGRRFQQYAANLSELVRPTPKLPPLDLPDTLTGTDEELRAMHRSYTRAIKRALGGGTR